MEKMGRLRHVGQGKAVEHYCTLIIMHIILTAMLMLALPSYGHTGQIGNEDDFLKNVEAGWEALISSERALLSYSIKLTRSRTFSPELKKESSQSVELIRVAKGSRGVLVEHPKKLDAGNLEYRFLLKRTEVSQPWTVAGTELQTDQTEPSRPKDRVDEGSLLLHPVSWYMKPGDQLVRAIKDRKLRLGNRLVLPTGRMKVEFRLTLPPPISEEDARKMEEQINRLPAEQRATFRTKLREKRSRNDELEGELTLEPTLNYLIVEGQCRIVTQPGIKLHFTRDARKDSSSGSVLCDEIVSSHVGEKFRQDETYTFMNYGTEPVSDNQYYLSHYGFPEPIGTAPPPLRRPMWIYLLCAALGLIGMSIALGRVWRRFHSSPASKL
jgi:hypothetical protein